MLIALHKKEENIAEYILYMWQVEDIIRALNFDIDLIQEKIIDGMSDNEDTRKEIRHWYSDIIGKLRIQGKEKSGHLRDFNELLVELNYLHGTLIGILGDEKYKAICQSALEDINEFKKRANTEEISDIEVCLNALYGKLMLRLQQKEISPESESSFQKFAQLLGYLSVKYKDMKAGKLM